MAMNLITDRTQADVTRVKSLAAKGQGMTAEEWQEFLHGPDGRGSRGAYNVSDFQRVNRAMAYLRDEFLKEGSAVKVNIQEGWDEGTIPSKSELDQYLDNVRAIRKVLTVGETTPEVPESMDHLTVDKANAIEEILIDVEDLLNKLLAAFYYSGELFSGEV
jgi:hypothetical protein